MSIKKGTTAIVDRYKGSQLIEKVYKGTDLIFDAYTEVTGTLPLTFNSRAAVALKNYRIHGTSAGAGVETENLIVGYIDNASIQLADGKIVSNVAYDLAIAPITQGVKYGVLFRRNWKNTVYGFFTNYPSKGSFTYNASRSDADNMTSFVFEAPITGYVALWSAHNDYYHNDICVVQSDFAPTTYIPSGFKIPILCQSKIVTDNLFDKNATDANNGYVDGYHLISDGTTSSNSSWAISEYMPITGGLNYTFNYGSLSSSPAICYYDSDKHFISGIPYGGQSPKTVSVPQNISYIRFSFMKSYVDDIMFVQASSLPDHYIPHFYQSNYDLFVGDSKLYADEYLDYGEQKVYKLKEVHKDTVTINGIEWDILGYDHDTVYKNDNTLAQHSVTIQTHDCISELQFDAREALFAFPEGLAAGTYHFTVSQQPWYAGDVGKTMQFTLVNAIPADGVIVLGNAYNATMIGSTISVYASCSATTATETATISEGSDGTDLGSVGNAISGNTNSIQRALLGSNNYNESAIRQYLNSDGTAGTYWTPQNKWDRPPSWNASIAGLLYKMDPEFVSVIGKVKKRTAKNTVSDGGGYIDTEEKVFLLSRTEVYAGTNNNVDEGGPYRYFSEFSDLSSAGIGADSNRTKYRNNVAKYWCLRSPITGDASYPFYAYPSGTVNIGSSAMGVVGVAPACCIVLDDINANPYLQSLFLKPTDPPVPLPAIQAYQGENTLSSTETLGEVTVKGRIREPTYRRVEYLKSTGTQYIITDIVPTNTTKTVLDVEFGTWKLTTHGDSERGLIGADSLSPENKSTEIYRINLSGTTNSSDDRAFSFYAGYGWRNGIGCYLYNPAIPSRNILILQSNMGSWGSTSISLTEAKTLREPTLPMPIFGSARLYEATGSIVRSPFKVTNMSLYNCKIYDSGNALSHNLVPVEREDGELGLLDTMTNKFYANAGTGTFEKGEYI